jgi:hypothetical protein
VSWRLRLRLQSEWGGRGRLPLHPLFVRAGNFRLTFRPKRINVDNSVLVLRIHNILLLSASHEVVDVSAPEAVQLVQLLAQVSQRCQGVLVVLGCRLATTRDVLLFCSESPNIGIGPVV